MVPRKKAAQKTKDVPTVKPKAEPKQKVKKFVSVSKEQFHPFQRVRVPLGFKGVMLEEDSWLKCQIEAGIIKEL